MSNTRLSIKDTVSNDDTVPAFTTPTFSLKRQALNNEFQHQSHNDNYCKCYYRDKKDAKEVCKIRDGDSGGFRDLSEEVKCGLSSTNKQTE